MNYIKKHKLTCFIILAYTIAIVFGFVIYKMFLGNSGLPVYGDRLDDIQSVPIEEEKYSKIQEEIGAVDYVIKVDKPVLKGRIFNVYITVGDNVQIANAKALATRITGILSEEQLKLYDVQVFINKDYKCTLNATGEMDEDGNFTSDVVVSFASDLSKNSEAESFGIGKSEKVDYNSEQKIEIKDDGEYVIYGYTKDKVGATSCSVKVVKKSSENKNSVSTITSATSNSFPIIGYLRRNTKDFVWTKDR